MIKFVINMLINNLNLQWISKSTKMWRNLFLNCSICLLCICFIDDTCDLTIMSKG